MSISEPSWAKPFRQAVRRGLIEEDIDDAELARRLTWKPQRLSNYMRGQRKPGAQELIELAKALPGVQLYELVSIVADVDEADVMPTLAYLLLTEMSPNDLKVIMIHLERLLEGEGLLAAAARKKTTAGVQKAKPRKTQARPERPGP